MCTDLPTQRGSMRPIAASGGGARSRGHSMTRKQHARRPPLKRSARSVVLRGTPTSRLCRVLLIALVALGVAVPSAGAAPNKDLGFYLGQMWKTALETPTPQNPFGGGDFLCIKIDGVVAPMAGQESTFTCTVKPGTRIFIAAWTTECSSFPGDHEGFGTTEAELRACAVTSDEGVTATVSITGINGGNPVPLSSVESGPVMIHLPQDNIFEVSGAQRNGLSVAHGLVYLTDPLTAGTYTIQGLVTFPDGSTRSFTTTIIVQ